MWANETMTPAATVGKLGDDDFPAIAALQAWSHSSSPTGVWIRLPVSRIPRPCARIDPPQCDSGDSFSVRE